MSHPKLYLAGPEVFLPNAANRANEQRELCYAYGFIPLHPMDNNIDLVNRGGQTATFIYRGDTRQVRECDIVVANCNPFRSVCVVDDGTSYELGFGNALGKISYGYIEKLEILTARTVREYPTTFNALTGVYIDKDGYCVTDSFGTSINLMLQCGMSENGGRLVEGNFEDCLKAIRKDLDVGNHAF